MEFIDKIAQMWCKEFKSQRGIDYELQGKDTKAIGLMLKRAKEKSPNINSDEMLKKFEVLFRKALAITDEFTRNNMTLPFLNSQINKIKLLIKKDTHVRKQQQYKPLEIDEIKQIFPDAELVWSNVFKEFKDKPKVEEKKLSKLEYIRRFGASGFSESEYKKYTEQFKEIE